MLIIGPKHWTKYIKTSFLFLNLNQLLSIYGFQNHKSPFAKIISQINGKHFNKAIKRKEIGDSLMCTAYCWSKDNLFLHPHEEKKQIRVRFLIMISTDKLKKNVERLTESQKWVFTQKMQLKGCQIIYHLPFCPPKIVWAFHPHCF